MQKQTDMDENEHKSIYDKPGTSLWKYGKPYYTNLTSHNFRLNLFLLFAQSTRLNKS